MVFADHRPQAGMPSKAAKTLNGESRQFRHEKRLNDFPKSPGPLYSMWPMAVEWPTFLLTAITDWDIAGSE
jgi:hypothetical protein